MLTPTETIIGNIVTGLVLFGIIWTIITVMGTKQGSSDEWEDLSWRERGINSVNNWTSLIKWVVIIGIILIVLALISSSDGDGYVDPDSYPDYIRHY
jgi:amino acid transporter|tara:strand:+ start:1085 stop:1375 length:291 start_codon:yes stop_codon:yes gene_type:complete